MRAIHQDQIPAHLHLLLILYYPLSNPLSAKPSLYRNLRLGAHSPLDIVSWVST
jgi:hypothetical protein